VADLYEEIVDALGEIGGVHPGFRVLHAKGAFVEGAFEATPRAGELSRAAHLDGFTVPVLVRFSNGGGDPGRPDNARTDGRGMAVKLQPPGAEEHDIVAISIPLFFVRTPEAFLEFTRARKPEPETGHPDGEVLGAFLGSHPDTVAALRSIVPALGPPRSYATCAYNALHAFALLDGAGERVWVRWRLEPEAGVEMLGEGEIGGAGADFLAPELRDRLAAGPIGFVLRAQLAGPEDPLDDPTKAWPAEREWVEMGRIELTGTVEPETTGLPVVFDPMRLPDGIEPSEDRILHARPPAYSISIARRTASAS
jgi:catalase